MGNCNAWYRSSTRSFCLSISRRILALIVIVFGLGIYAFNLYDAYQNGKKRDIGTPLNSVKEQYRNLLDQGFPYLMVSPFSITYLCSCIPNHLCNFNWIYEL